MGRVAKPTLLPLLRWGRRAPRGNRSVPRRLAHLALRALGLLVLGSLLWVLLYRWVDPPATFLMLQRGFAAVLARESGPAYRYQWTDYQDVSPNFLLAVVAAEDQKFPEHHGFDLGAIADALEYNEAGRGLRGASTISQQVAKNVFLWPARSWLRKALEAYFTVLIEVIWGKRRILEVYVNVAQTGPHLFGVAAASAAYFRTTPERLTRWQAALLASILPDPEGRSVTSPSRTTRERQRWILGQMRNLGGSAYLAGL